MQSRTFRQVLLSLFPTTAMLDGFLFDQLNIQRQSIALGDSLDDIMFKVLQDAEAKGWTAELLEAAREVRPQDIPLFEFAQQFGLAPATLAPGDLERMIRATNSMLDIVTFRTRVAQIEGQVCRITVDLGGHIAFGTGFLVAPAIVLTNYHVIEPVIKGTARVDDVRCTFDYKMLADGTTLNLGTPYGLDSANWDADHSEYSPLDMQVVIAGAEPNPDQLDYAFLRLAVAAGNEPVGGASNKDPGAQARGWIKAANPGYGFATDTALFIAQHPEGRPLKLALDTDSVLGLNGNKTRVRYRTNTDAGSSGSPCFDANWNMVALHHSGDPNYEEFHHPEYNEGIPVDAIRALLRQRKKDDLLT